MGVIALVVVLHLTVLPPLLSWVLGRSSILRLAVSVLALAPLAVAMGLPFPSGFRLLREQRQATLLAIEVGLRVVMLVAVACYLVALAVVGRLGSGS